MWVNKKTLNILAQIEGLINQEFNKPEVLRAIQAQDTELQGEIFQAVGFNRFEETSRFNKELRDSVNDDWLNLYDIQGFLKKSKKNTT